MQSFADQNNTHFEQKQTATTINGTSIYYSNNAFPNVNDATINVFTINYYDGYNFDALPVDISSLNAITNVKGMLTGSKTRILTTDSWITNWNYYDAKSKPFYTYTKNEFLNTVASVQSEFDFPGNITQTTSTHSRNNVTTTIVDKFEYDKTGRLTKQTQAIDGASDPEIIAASTYNELGQLVSKGVGNKASQNRVQNVDYKYNIRGWLKNINDINAIGNDLFAFQINYNDSTDPNKKLFNGNISQTFWKTTNDDTSIKNYTYTYDKLNRLRNADDNLNKFNESLTYDMNGNILKLKRNGELVDGVPNINIPSHFGLMDDLTYSYDNGNKLQIVSDLGSKTHGFKDDFTGNGDDTSVDYTYDANGNMKTDTNKGITAVSYNHLNLPDEVIIQGQTIKYYYDATGIKQQKIASTFTTDYAGGFIYENNQLQFFSQPEGYVSNNSGTFDYIYQYKDHLGNVRLSYDKDLVIQEENNYYPFGLKHKGYNAVTNITKGNRVAQKYKYNGKELQDEQGLDFYDFGARNYNPALGRWMNIDPLAEKSRRFSPYVYALNNPVFFIDPDGMEASPPDWYVNSATQEVQWFEGNGKIDGYTHIGPSAFQDNGNGTTTIYNDGGTKDTAINLKDISITDYKTNYVSSGEYGPDKDFGHALMFAGGIAAPILGATGGLTAGGAYLWSETTAALSQITWGSAGINMASNATAQYLANGQKFGEINMVSTASSIIPGIIPAAFGETITWTPNRLMDGKGPTTPDSLNKWAVQAGSAIISNRFGKATDNYLSGSGFGEAMVREYFKGIIAVGANSAPTLVKE